MTLLIVPVMVGELAPDNTPEGWRSVKRDAHKMRPFVCIHNK